MTLDKLDYQTEVPIHILCFSLGYSILVIFCYFISGIVTNTFSQKDSFVRFLLLEILGCFQAIVGASEGTCIMFHYGVVWWCVYTSLRITLHLYTFRGASADPVMVIISRKLPVIYKIIAIIVQLATGFGAYFLMPYFWSFSVSSIHSHKVEMILENKICSFDLKIPFAQAFIVQFVYILSIYYVDYLTPFSIKKITVPIYLIALAAPGLSYTGMHTSVLPVIVFNWSCHDTTTLAILLIYILPPVAARLLAQQLNWVEEDPDDSQQEHKVDYKQNHAKINLNTNRSVNNSVKKVNNIGTKSSKKGDGKQKKINKYFNSDKYKNKPKKR